MPPRLRYQAGFSLLELLVALLIGASLLTGFSQIVSSALNAATQTEDQQSLADDAQFAIQRMRREVMRSSLLLLPTRDNPATTSHPLNSARDYREDIRRQTIPAPVGQEYETAVLAMSVPASVNFDGNSYRNSDNDRDNDIDEDWPADINFDQAPGLFGIDDDGDGQVDEGSNNDDDEDGATSEDPINGVDDDGDGRIDEDPGADMSGNGNVDDDSDGSDNEDWPDTLAYFIDGTDLIERRAVQDAANGRAYTEEVIASNVSELVFERLSLGANAVTAVRMTLTLSVDAQTVSYTALVRLGAAS